MNHVLDADGSYLFLTIVYALMGSFMVLITLNALAGTAAAWIATLILTLAALLFLAILRARYVRNPRGFRKSADERAEKWLRATVWFFTARKFKVVFPWDVTLVAAFVISLLVFGTDKVSNALLSVLELIVVLAVLMIAAIVIGLLGIAIWHFALGPALRFIFGRLRDGWSVASRWLYNHVIHPLQMRKWKQNSSPVKPAPVKRVKVVKPSEPARKRWNPFAVMAEILVMIVKAIYYHRKICPYIDLPEDPKPTGKSPFTGKISPLGGMNN
jgi:hypothetical protein